MTTPHTHLHDAFARLAEQVRYHEGGGSSMSKTLTLHLARELTLIGVPAFPANAVVMVRGGNALHNMATVEFYVQIDRCYYGLDGRIDEKQATARMKDEMRDHAAKAGVRPTVSWRSDKKHMDWDIEALPADYAAPVQAFVDRIRVQMEAGILEQGTPGASGGRGGMRL